MTNKSSFYSQRPCTEPTDAIAAPAQSYKGLDRRIEARRGHSDRREDVRFEIDKQDRRVNKGRREDDNVPDFW